MTGVTTPQPSGLIERMQDECVSVRLECLDLADTAGSGHIGPAFSCVELLVALYSGFLEVRPDEPRWEDRDRFILSKGHACSALYPILAARGFFDPTHLSTFTRLGTILGDHPDLKKIPGVDFSSGSLGHGLSVGAGMATALRLRGSDSRVVVLLGDGELNEGQNWEAIAYASHEGLRNLIAIVDVNDVSVDGQTSEVLDLEPLEDKWASFGWEVTRIDGHDLASIRDALSESANPDRAAPFVIIADTIVGRGIGFIEGMAEWHVGFLAGVDRERAEQSIRGMWEAGNDA